VTFIGAMQDSKKISGRQTENYSSGALDESGTFFGTKITGSCPTDAASPKTGDPTKLSNVRVFEPFNFGRAREPTEGCARVFSYTAIRLSTRQSGFAMRAPGSK
jgi:hypothetical protein